ncbi:MAG: HDIG domain-containing protein [Ardenticatenaceae bacterium]|nr:HDIG domain-containing protein [Ardenticatenaceae bacterium]MCB9443084.1 HDIG domain-containing protein [Ardenticatenaceae bacterium]
MNKDNDSRRSGWNWWQQMLQGSLLWLFAILLTIGMTAILSFNLTPASNVNVVVGQPSANDILAPRSLTYTSEIMTAQARQQASAGVSAIYSPLDLNIGRAQLSLARAVFSFVETVRADSLANNDVKLRYLQAIKVLKIDEQIGLDLLEMSSADYTAAKADVLAIIDELMRQDIREDQLSAVQRSARRQASLDLTPAQEAVVTSLAPQFIVPTVFPDEEATAVARQDAAAAVEPIVRSVTKDQRIIRTGDIITEADVEMLEQLGLMQQALDLQDVASLFIASLLSVTLIILYWQQYRTRLRGNGRYLLGLALLLLLFTLAARLMTSGTGILVYWFPIAALSMLLAVIFDSRFAMIITVVVAALVGYLSRNSLEITVYIAAGGLLALLTLRDAYAQRINAFFRAGLLAALGHIIAILIFRLPQNPDLIELFQLMLYGLGNGVLSSAITLIGFFIMGSLFGVTTSLQLQELSRLDHPLLQELLRKAPGTYHHSIMVANLAEQAAEKVKANSTLIRVGAFYHDIGKMKRPPFFTENQEGVSPHDALDPYSSARIIISHVTDGLEMARKHRLPDRIRDFIAEHHGDRVVKSFYLKAVEEAGENGDSVDIEKFRHVGPRPRSRETGIVMLADATEATSSALRPNSEKEIEKLVSTIVGEHLAEGQLDNSGLTLGDVKAIQDSFVKTLKGRFHMRVKYPGNEKIEAEAAQTEGETDAKSNGDTAVSPLPNHSPQETPQDAVVES